VLRRTLLSAAGNHQLRGLVTAAPPTRALVARYVAGETRADAIATATGLVRDGLEVTIDHLGEDTTDPEGAAAATAEVVGLLEGLGAAGLTSKVEVSVKLSALGQALPAGGEQVALEHARAVCRVARNVGTTVTLDMEDHTTTDSTLRVLAALRDDYPDTGVAIQACLLRSEADCEALAGRGSRVRLCKGAYDEPASVAHAARAAVDRAYVRCARILMAGDGYPMLATHDPRLVAIGRALAAREGRTTRDYELQMLHGVRPQEQRRLAGEGERMRVYLPFGTDWYGYLVRRMAERPANLMLFLRSLAPE
jgi:proline dehydrogenase